MNIENNIKKNMTEINTSLAHFFQDEIEKLLIHFKSRRKIALEIGVSPSLIHTYMHGGSKPTVQTILKLATLNEKIAGEKIELFCARWCTVYGRKYPGPNMVELAIALREAPLVKVHTKNLMPAIRLLANSDFETVTLSDIEFVLDMQDKIGFELNIEIINALFKQKNRGS